MTPTELDQEAKDLAAAVENRMTQRGIDKRKAEARAVEWEDTCKALRKEVATKDQQIDAQATEIKQYQWREMHYTTNAGNSPLYRHGEAIWLRTRATDSQISGMLKSRDDAIIARSDADREVGRLTGERDELQRQFSDLRTLARAVVLSMARPVGYTDGVTLVDTEALRALERAVGGHDDD